MEKYKTCKYCGESILAVAKKCKYCKSSLTAYAGPQSPEEARQQQAKEDAENAKAAPFGCALIAGYILMGLVCYFWIDPESLGGWVLFFVAWGVSGGLLSQGICLIDYILHPDE